MFWNKIKSNAPEIILLGAVAFLQFYRLGMGEIQSHDESRYIMRAEACLRFGAWLDQTQYAIGGLFSSSHPPLIVWMMALVRFLFGTGTFASRLISPIAAIFALSFFYKLARKFFSRPTALFATAALGAGQHFLLYSHHGQFDIPMFAFVVAASYYAIRCFDEGNTKLAIIAGILFGCTLLSKTVQGLYLLPFICSLIYIYPTKGRYKNLVIIVAVFLFVSLPWHVFMLIRYADFFNDNAGLIASLKTNSYAEGQTRTAWWYYLNQIIINFPLLVIGFIVIPQLFKRWKSRDTAFDRLCLISFLWFAGILVFLSSFYTRMLHFSLFLLLPSSLVLCFSVEEFLLHLRSKSKIGVACILLVLALGWSLSELIRISLKEHALHSMSVNPLLMLLCIALAAIMFILLYKYFSASLPEIVILVAVIFLITTDFYRWSSRKNETFTDGAEAVGNILLHSPGIHTLIAYHEGSPYQYMLPQLNYYSGYAFIGWDSTKMETTRTWKELDSLVVINHVPRSDASVLYVSWDAFYTPKQEEKDLLMRINHGLSTRYTRVLQTKKYRLYWELK